MKLNLAKIIKLLIVLVVFIALWWMPSTAFGIPNLTILQQRMIAIFAFAALMWILEVVPAWVTSVLIVVIMLFTVSDSSLAVLINPANFPASQRVVDEVTGEVTGVAGLISYKAIMASFIVVQMMAFKQWMQAQKKAFERHVKDMEDVKRYGEGIWLSKRAWDWIQYSLIFLGAWFVCFVTVVILYYTKLR